MQKESAWILTLGLLTTHSAKTAHGLIRGSDKYDILAVIDKEELEFQDAGELLDKRKRNIPVFGSLESALKNLAKPKYIIIGVAMPGGKLPISMHELIKKAIQQGIHIINGLHEFLSDKREFRELSIQHKVELIDIRKPKPREQLKFWSGKIYDVSCPIVAVLGLDTHTGKRTTCRILEKTCQAHALNAHMIFTGQTGWLQSGKYGFVLDTTANDFVSGELENAILNCYENEKPDIIFIEGQSSLRNPSGPCGSEILISGNAQFVVLVYNPKQEFFDDNPRWGKLPSLESEMALIECYKSKVIAIALNTSKCTLEEAERYQKSLQDKLQIPVLLPIEKGVDEMINTLKTIILNHGK